MTLQRSIGLVKGQSSAKIEDAENYQYFIVLFLSLWLVLTTFPFVFNNYFIIFRVSTFSYSDFMAQSDEFKSRFFESLKQMSYFQSITSIFFNSNHCVHFIVYFLFYSIFRNSICTIFSSKIPKALKKKSF